MKYKITLKDFILRSWLDIKMNTRFIFNVTKPGIFKVSSDYKLVFIDDFKEDYRTKWESGDSWWAQPYHPGNLDQWYDDEQIIQTDNGVYLSAIVKPKYFDEILTTIPNAVGMLRTYEAWKYGIFKFTAKLPYGTYLWPALWLSGKYSWPPEIDLLEATSLNTLDFHNNKNLLSTIHFKNEDGDHISNGSRTHRLSNKVTKEFIEYVIWWEEDFIKIYYNGYLVRHITDKEVLDGMSEEQRVLINSAIQTGFNMNNINPFIVTKVQVFQK